MNAYIVRKENYDEKGYWLEDNLIITLDKTIAKKEFEKMIEESGEFNIPLNSNTEYVSNKWVRIYIKSYPITA